jgi:hypothetical protein
VLPVRALRTRHSRLEGRESSRRSDALHRTVLAAAVALASLTFTAASDAHYKGCRTNACDQRVSQPRHHATTSSTAWAWTYTAFDDCVVLHESTRERYATNGTDDSYYQWAPLTWQTAQHDVGVAFSTSPFDATLEQQTYVFNLWEPTHSSQWSTVPECA